MSEFFRSTGTEELTTKENLFVDTKKSEHLNDGVQPIIVSIMDKESARLSSDELEKIIAEGEYVDYYGDPHTLRENNMLNAGYQTYTVSDINEKDKYSKGYFNCTGIVAIGISKETNREISLLSHQDPWEFLGTSEADFDEDISMVLKKIKHSCVDGTIDIVAFGGHNTRPKEHKDSIKK